MLFVLYLVSFVNLSFAQDFSYHLHEVPLVLNSSSYGSSNDTSRTGMFIGSHHPGGVVTGFIYDHYGIIGAPQTRHDLPDLLGESFPTEWTGSSCVGINEMGQVVGAFERTVTVDGVSRLERRGFLLDLDLFSEVPLPIWEYLPKPLGSTSSYGRKINNSGLVLMQAEPYAEYLYDSASGALSPVVDPLTDLPINAPKYSRAVMTNDRGQLSGTTVNPEGGNGYILTPATDEQEADIFWAPNQIGLYRLNLHGDWCGYSWFVNRHGTTTLENAVRFTVGKGLETLSTEYSRLEVINDSGDAAGGFNRSGSKAYKPAVYHNELGWILLEGTRMKGKSSDLSLWNDSNTYRQVEWMTNRNTSGLPDVVARATLTTTTGKGKSAVTTTVRKYYYMEGRSND